MIILKWKHLSLEDSERNLTKAEPLKNTTTINPPPREFPVNSAALEINCPFPLVTQNTNRLFHTLPLEF